MEGGKEICFEKVTSKKVGPSRRARPESASYSEVSEECEATDGYAGIRGSTPSSMIIARQ